MSERPLPSALYRWMVLLFISLAMFGNYYIYDSISPLADLLKSQLCFTDSEIGLLNGIYSFPNIIMVLIGGIIIDRIGTRKSVFIFTVLIMLGAVVTAVKGDIFWMASGRLIFGLGAESMIVAITTIIARWFKGKQLAFAFGLNLTIARLGSFMALNAPSWGRSLYDYWQSPLWITVGAGVFAVICIIVFYIMDVYANKKFTMEGEGNQDKIEIKEIFKFGVSFWYITALCVTFYSAMFPFQTFAIKFFQEAHGTTREVGGNLSSMLTLAAMIFTPLFGLLTDKIGKRSLMMMFGSLLIVPVYLIMAYKIDLASFIGLQGGLTVNIAFFGIEQAVIPFYLIIPMSLMGIAFSLIPAVMWPSVAYIVDPKKLGTAYGLMTMIQNIGLFGFNLLIGWANDFSGASAANPNGYTLGMWIFTSLGFFGLLFAFLLRQREMGIHGHGLENASGLKK
ncbi:MAG: MFS transporter [Ignavibacteriales bacterium]|nr:MFS transporter [Ignavibacteriales bacterium]